MFAVIVNTIAILVGCSIGLLLRKGIPETMSDALMKGLGLCTVIIGVQGAVREQDILLLILAVIGGIFIGEAIDLDGKVNRLAAEFLAKFRQTGNASRIVEAFVTSCLIMNVGAMVIVGSLNAGLSHDYAMLYTKSLLDFISGIMMGATLGIGVMGSAAFTLIFQGMIVLLADYLAPFLTECLVAEINTTGCLLILAIGLNMLEITKLRVINYLPSLLIVPILLVLETLF